MSIYDKDITVGSSAQMNPDGVPEPSGTCDKCQADTVVQLALINYRDKRTLAPFSKFGHSKAKRDAEGKIISQTLHIDRGEFIQWWQRCAQHYPSPGAPEPDQRQSHWQAEDYLLTMRNSFDENAGARERSIKRAAE